MDFLETEYIDILIDEQHWDRVPADRTVRPVTTPTQNISRRDRDLTENAYGILSNSLRYIAMQDFSSSPRLMALINR
ncbi:hypothetical protein [Actinomadura sp. NBRC 104412]|uniref:hypothetical protein n=1 Tax=Actinomadura sp. NBRC 104412 TaxID=3032203 RepID=UPI002553B5BA|nr:hypothetical protein [Actinomadura sp. NBRC 104412]